MKNITYEEKIEDTTKRIPKMQFTVLNFIYNMKKSYSGGWNPLFEAFRT